VCDEEHARQLHSEVLLKGARECDVYLNPHNKREQPFSRTLGYWQHHYGQPLPQTNQSLLAASPNFCRRATAVSRALHRSSCFNGNQRPCQTGLRVLHDRLTEHTFDVFMIDCLFGVGSMGSITLDPATSSRWTPPRTATGRMTRQLYVVSLGNGTRSCY
jgi:hypothetical protein